MYETCCLSINQALVSPGTLNLTTENVLQCLREPSKCDTNGVHRTIDINSTRR